MTKLQGIFSFEGDWETRLDDKKSVLPLLDTLQRVEGMRFIHRRIGTVPELDHYLKTVTYTHLTLTTIYSV